MAEASKRYSKVKKAFDKKNILISLACFTISFVILLLTSKNSFLYPFNDWVDANAFFTVGKSMVHGIVPYRDLFEQKGPLLYLIYGIGSLISFKSFFGIFVIEVFFWTISLIVLYKILRMFLSFKSSFLILPIFMSIIATSNAFSHGGSAEELCAPFFFITLYYFIKHFKVKELNKKEMLLSGIMAGFILLIKYTLLGFWISFTIAIFIDYLLKKDYRKAIIYPLVLLFGMLIPFSLFLIYFAINNAVYDFIYTYFYINMSVYSELSSGIILRIGELFKGFVGSLTKEYVSLVIFLVMIVLLWKLDINKKFKILFLITFFITILGVYFGLKFYQYYLLFILFFISIGLLSIFNLLSKYIDKINNRIYVVICITISSLCIINGYYNANYKEYMSKDITEFFQYEYASIINEYSDATVLNMGKLDCGVYTLAGIYPSTYFFEVQNISYERFPDMIDSMQEYVQNKEVMFIVYYTKLDLDALKKQESILFENYELLEERYQKFENSYFYGYLFKVK